MPSSLRRRKGDKQSKLASAEPEDDKVSDVQEDEKVPEVQVDGDDDSEELRLVSISSLEELTKTTKQKGRKRRGGFIFFLGGLFGLLVAGFFAQKNEYLYLPEFAADLVSDLNLD